MNPYIIVINQSQIKLEYNNIDSIYDLFFFFRDCSKTFMERLYEIFTAASNGYYCGKAPRLQGDGICN